MARLALGCIEVVAPYYHSIPLSVCDMMWISAHSCGGILSATPLLWTKTPLTCAFNYRKPSTRAFSSESAELDRQLALSAPIRFNSALVRLCQHLAHPALPNLDVRSRTQSRLLARVSQGFTSVTVNHESPGISHFDAKTQLVVRKETESKALET